ncbi:MAG: zinc ribbon domain-containing protein, partial [Candidatus Hodarchaeota archaeon]
VPNQSHDITAEQEFWGHCSNIQAWVEHDYDTRILMSNISFPLLRELVKAGDPMARKVFKEEIALRLESGYPSVVQYLLNQGYIRYFTPSEFKTVLESTELIKSLSSDPKVLSRFLISCVSKFPTIVEDILIQVLKLPEGKKLIISSMGISGVPRMPYLRPSFSSNPQYLLTLKTALGNLFKSADEKLGKDISDCIQAIEDKLLGQEIHLPNMSKRSRLETLRELFFDMNVLDHLGVDQKLQLVRKFMGEIQRILSKCPYCGKVIPKGQDTCDWCGHKKDDEGGFFPHPYIYKPPGGGGGSIKGTIAVAAKIKM